MSQTTITDIGTVGIPVSDQDKAAEFFVGMLGFEKRLDVRSGRLPAGSQSRPPARPPGSRLPARYAGPDAGTETGVRFLVPDAETEHPAMRQRGIEVGDLLRWPGVTMFKFQDPDGNTSRDRRGPRLS